MIRQICQRFALSEKGARDFCKGVWWTTALDIALMLPAVYAFLFLEDYLQMALRPNAEAGRGLAYFAILGLAFVLVIYAAARLQYRHTYTCVYEESANRRISLAEKLRKLPLAFFGERDLSDLTATVMDDCTDLEHTFSHAVPQLFASLLSLLLVAAGMAAYNWQLTVALFWVAPVAMAVILLSGRKMRKDNQSNYLNKRAVSEQIQEGLDNMQEIKACHREADYLDTLDRKLRAYERRLTQSELLLGIAINGGQSLLKLGLASVIITGAWLMAEGSVSLFTYLVFTVIGTRVYSPVQEVMNNLAALSYLDVRINRMKEMEALPMQQGTTAFEPQGYDIRFDHVAFSYEQGKTVLADVSFTARQGEITALVGPSGSGKSTVARLAARFWDASAGSITLGGTDIREVDPETLLRHYSVVFQDVVLFNATVLDNIRIGRQDATDEEALRVARLACCDEFVGKMPQGYYTVIGENGDTLSGGERQRISIARALLKDAPIVLLDEATASLDVENETRIQRAISALVKDKTVLVIAHRMRTIAHADKVVALENGKVAESGRPEELMRKGGLLSRMMRRQSLEGT